MFPGFDVAVNDQILMRVMHRAADVAKESKPRVDAEPVLVAIRRDRQTVDVLHHEVGELPVRHAAVQQLRDASMLQRRQDLTLGAKAPAKVPVVGARVKDLDRDLLFVLSVVAVGEKHDAHTAASELSNYAVSADASNWTCGIECVQECAGDLGFQDSVRSLVSDDQRLDFRSETTVGAALLRDPVPSFRRGQLDCVLEDRFDFEPSRNVNRWCCHITLGRAMLGLSPNHAARCAY